MRISINLLLCFLIGTAVLSSADGLRAQPVQIKMAIHGGAGTITPESMTSEREQEYRAALEAALQTGYGVLSAGGTSVDAVVATLQVMEESPLFNAGRGAVFTSAGTVELDASIMDGWTRGAGAIAGVRHIRSPIALARLVMEASPHVMMVGDGAEAFGREHGLEVVPNEYFHTENRRSQLDRIRDAEQQEGGGSNGDAGTALDPDRSYGTNGAVAPGPDGAYGTTGALAPDPDRKYGTVGAVALDRHGNLAAATSTGGMTNKRWGRVGDSPIIGAGTFADNETCAVSATGHGEYFIRGVIAYDIAAMMRYAGLSVVEAANAVINGKLTAAGGTGGVIAMDREGNVAMPFNTAGMYRGIIDAVGNVTVEIYR